ncbi:hypothetical protein DPMN_189297 [Dreissena polymorpha]|uniref:Transmembrane protein n=1 Tax=Dreissena polymorpha TaxID=45954 RepID=A0A9D4IC32_DREPO|nr:hypothetical protein DPMN_189297 [Dreissena polymorpha]
MLGRGGNNVGCGNLLDVSKKIGGVRGGNNMFKKNWGWVGRGVVGMFKKIKLGRLGRGVLYGAVLNVGWEGVMMFKKNWGWGWGVGGGIMWGVGGLRGGYNVVRGGYNMFKENGGLGGFGLSSDNHLVDGPTDRQTDRPTYRHEQSNIPPLLRRGA